MSYDVEWWKSKGDIGEACNGEYHDMKWWERLEDEGRYIDSDLNITSNLRDMFSWALEVEYWVDAVEGNTGAEVAHVLLPGINKMILYPEEAKKYNSPNGWGTYDNALKFLIDLAIEAVNYKDFYLRIDK